jgi:A/G-specific adenine glycosylase
LHLDSKAVGRIRRQILVWHRQNGRHELPWRTTRDPWEVLLAELMLQRTRADLVVPVYGATLTRFPTAEAFAAASAKEVEFLLRPLGLRHRAGRIQEVARAVVNGVPTTSAGLLRIPGVGDYVAAATLCFAFGRRVAIIDPNVIRILDHLLHVRSARTRPRTDPLLWLVAGALLPRRGVREWNYALLDFGAAVCSAQPKCGDCPLRLLCPTGREL